MAMIIWILLGLGMGLIASKTVSTTGEGTIVDALLGTIGARHDRRGRGRMAALALQLRFALMSCLCGGLMCPSPE